ncbi:hypothetical protein J0X19_06730 [Hymenobacter sp. BT186]|uniref:Uncharacterized protein n=1 Tax=Hymenobacter telluris TaxID=2816474 RepID=A0A939EV01_9BACT|nr:hypothetical protein [Hymenobacter telluris]MBO0357634.1 hypothetical protein [Hymenobacter telluris]MBW3373661.1 hypothetical protein [Hymenobacter norwichensis]
MALDLTTDALIDTVSLPGARVAPLVREPGIPSSQTVTGLEVRLSRVFIENNRTPKVFPFPGFANVYLLLVVFDNLNPEPQTLTLSGFARIDDEEDLPVDKTAYYWKQSEPAGPVPSQVHVLLSVLKSKKGLRDTGAVMAQARDSDDYRSLVSEVVGAITSAPARAAEVLLQLGAVVGNLLKDVEDKPLFTQVISFTDINGDFDTLGKTQVTKQNNYVQTTLTLIVRDPAREPSTGEPL